MIVFAFLMAAQAPEGPPDIPEMATYIRCVIAEARRLQPSGEPAETIARAATFHCQKQLEPAANALGRASDAVLKARGWPGGTRESAEPKVKAMAENAAVFVVVEDRLRAKQAH